jgi:hypothetical protein
VAAAAPPSFTARARASHNHDHRLHLPASIACSLVRLSPSVFMCSRMALGVDWKGPPATRRGAAKCSQACNQLSSVSPVRPMLALYSTPCSCLSAHPASARSFQTAHAFQASTACVPAHCDWPDCVGHASSSVAPWVCLQTRGGSKLRGRGPSAEGFNVPCSGSATL